VLTEKPGMDEKFLPEAPDRENNEGAMKGNFTSKKENEYKLMYFF
jgi:hypothetical protein